VIGIKIGSYRLTGLAAAAALGVFLALVIALIVYSKPTLAGWPLWVSFGLWIVFIGYWSAAAQDVAATKGSESMESRRFHQRLLNAAFILLLIPIPGLTGRFLPASRYWAGAGLIAQALSLLLAIWARRHLGRNWSGAITEAEGHQLVRTGPYRRIRHPIYSAMLGMFVGTALVWGQIHALVAVLILAGAYWRKIPLEEQNLREIFGAAYDDYRRESSALVPGMF
jgi:protein-S-isoprenylcysteine O-methyltransferase Ste14